MNTGLYVVVYLHAIAEYFTVNQFGEGNIFTMIITD